MGFTVDGFNRAKSDMASAFNKAIDDAEQLRKAAAEVSIDGSAVAPADSPEAPGDAGVSLVDAPRSAVDSVGHSIGKAST